MKKLHHYPVCCLILAVFLFCSAQYSTAQTDEEPGSPLMVARKLSEQLSRLNSLSFTFTQKTMGQMSGRTKQASGRAYFVKDSGKTMMRWNYLAPDRQVIISDGDKLNMYFESLNQMIIAPADRLQQDVTYSFFTGAKDIEEEFIVSEGGEIIEGTGDISDYDVIRLEPRSTTSQIMDIRLWVKDQRNIQRIQIVDNFETETIINISNIEENSLISDGKLVNQELFRFTPPAGTEIIHQ